MAKHKMKDGMFGYIQSMIDYYFSPGKHFLSTYNMPNTIPYSVLINMNKHDFSVELTLFWKSKHQHLSSIYSCQSYDSGI